MYFVHCIWQTKPMWCQCSSSSFQVNWFQYNNKWQIDFFNFKLAIRWRSERLNTLNNWKTEWVSVKKKLFHFLSFNGRFLCVQIHKIQRCEHQIRTNAIAKKPNILRNFSSISFTVVAVVDAFLLWLYGIEFLLLFVVSNNSFIPFLHQWNKTLTKFVRRTTPTTSLWKLFCRCSFDKSYAIDLEIKKRQINHIFHWCNKIHLKIVYWKISGAMKKRPS